MGPDYYQYNFRFDPAVQEILLAFLPEFGFEGLDFSEETTLKGYIPKSLVDDTFDDSLNSAIPVAFEFSKEILPNINWNESWESSFEPVVIDEFCALRASFHDPIGTVEHEIVIDPKMAFGTGHHETTSMMIELMKDIEHNEKTVFDYGCGTGVLAILAEKMGASSLVAIDYDINSVENTKENVVINECKKIRTLHGDLSIVGIEKFDIVLANINKNVLKESANHLFELTQKGGTLLLSGILNVDESEIISLYQQAGFTHQITTQKEEWVAVKFTRIS